MLKIKECSYHLTHLSRYSAVLDDLHDTQICIIVEKLTKNNEYKYLGSTTFLTRSKFKQSSIWCNTCGNIYNVNINISRYLTCTCLFDEYIYTGSSISYLTNWFNKV